MNDETSKTFDVVICSKRTGEIVSIVAATVEATPGRVFQENYEAHIVPAGNKYKVGDVLDTKARQP